MKIGDTVVLKGQVYSPVMTIVEFAAESKSIAMLSYYNNKQELVNNLYHVDSLIEYSNFNFDKFLFFIENVKLDKLQFDKTIHNENAMVSPAALLRILENLGKKTGLIEDDDKLQLVRK